MLNKYYVEPDLLDNYEIIYCNQLGLPYTTANVIEPEAAGGSDHSGDLYSEATYRFLKQMAENKHVGFWEIKGGYNTFGLLFEPIDQTSVEEWLRLVENYSDEYSNVVEEVKEEWIAEAWDTWIAKEVNAHEYLWQFSESTLRIMAEDAIKVEYEFNGKQVVVPLDEIRMALYPGEEIGHYAQIVVDELEQYNYHPELGLENLFNAIEDMPL